MKSAASLFSRNVRMQKPVRANAANGFRETRARNGQLVTDNENSSLQPIESTVVTGAIFANCAAHVGQVLPQLSVTVPKADVIYRQYTEWCRALAIKPASREEYFRVTGKF